VSGHFPASSMRSTGSPDKHDRHIGPRQARAPLGSVLSGSASQLSAAERVRGSGTNARSDVPYGHAVRFFPAHISCAQRFLAARPMAPPRRGQLSSLLEVA
jgi:hypothetical protein